MRHLAERNPELLRNLWLELTIERLLLAPALIATLVALSWTVAHDTWFARLGSWAPLIAAAVLLLYGTRRAGNSLREERLAGTWDMQRLSAQSAWQLALGKLFGATAFAWYLAGCCLLLTLPQRLLTAPPRLVLLQIAWVVLLGLIAQAMALVLALNGDAAQDARRRRGAIELSGLAVLLLGWDVLSPQASDALWREPLRWWTLELPREGFAIGSLIVFAIAAVLMLQRGLRAVLQERTLPIGWLALLALIGLWSGGFLWNSGAALLDVQWHGLQPPAWLAAAIDPLFRLGAGWTLLACTLAYACYAQAAGDPLSWRQAMQAAREGRWQTALAGLPLWLPTGLVALLCALAGVASLGAGEPALHLLAVPLFTLRDLVLMAAWTLTATPRRSAAIPFGVLLTAYVLLPALLSLIGLGPIAALLNPLLSWGQAGLLAAAAAVQLALALLWLSLRWQRVFAAAS